MIDLGDLKRKLSFGEIYGNCSIRTFIAELLTCTAIESKRTIYSRSHKGKFKNDLKTFIDKFNSYWCCCNDDEDSLLYYNESKEALMHIGIGSDGITTISFDSLVKEEADYFDQVCKEQLTNKKKAPIYMLSTTQQGYTFTEIGDLSVPLIRDNYLDKIAEDFDYIVKNIKEPNPPGKLVILSGIPGSGKTFYIKGLINEIAHDCMCVFLPSKLITELDGPSLLPVLLKHKYGGFDDWDDDCGVTLSTDKETKSKPIVFIAEDCDNYLTARDGADSSLISGLLNYTSGIMGDLLNIRFIASTNAKYLKVDSALKRNGRLLKGCLIDLLPPEKANSVYQRLTEGKGTFVFEEPASLADVYAKSQGIDVEIPEEMEFKEKKMGFGA